LTGTQIQVGFSITGWTDQTQAAALSCTINLGPAQTINPGPVTLTAGGNWTVTPTAKQVPAGSTISINATAVDSTGNQASDTTDDVKVFAINNPPPITVGTITKSRKTQKLPRDAVAFSVSGTYSTKLNPTSVLVEVLLFHGKQKSEVYSVTIDNNLSLGTWSTTVTGSSNTTKRQVFRVLLIGANGMVLGQACQKH
jgi:hypothetical protein